MISIRKHIFETNSSSSDYYGDYDDDYDYPDSSHGTQIVDIHIKWKEFTSESRKEEFIDTLWDDNGISDELDNIISEYLTKADPELQDMYYDKDEDIIKAKYDITLSIDEWEPGEPSDRYYPGSNPTPYYDYSNMMDVKEFPEEKDLIEKMMIVFRSHGWTEIEAIKSIRGEDIDEGEFDDNLNW